MCSYRLRPLAHVLQGYQRGRLVLNAQNPMFSPGFSASVRSSLPESLQVQSVQEKR